MFGVTAAATTRFGGVIAHLGAGQVCEGALFNLPPQHRQPLGLTVRQRLKEDPFDQAEDCAIRANPERQRQNDDRGKPGRSHQLSTGVAKIN
jgi:hypothetical protein